MVNTAEFVLVESDQVSSVARVNCLARALERLAGIEEFHTSAGHRCISISFNDVLIDETTLGESSPNSAMRCNLLDYQAPAAVAYAASSGIQKK